jgi:hypothetical protein
MSQEEPKIQIDSDWKAEAQAEKERLTQKEEAGGHGRSQDRPNGH